MLIIRPIKSHNHLVEKASIFEKWGSLRTMDHWLADYVIYFILSFSVFSMGKEEELDDTKGIWISDVQSFDTLIQRNDYSK